MENVAKQTIVLKAHVLLLLIIQSVSPMIRAYVTIFYPTIQ